jgi:uncharacterized protein
MCDDCSTDGLTRRGLLRGAGALGVAGLVGTAGPAAWAAESAGSRSRPPRLLVFSRTTGFRHMSIEVGVETVKQLGDEHGFAVEATEDQNVFTDRKLRGVDAVLFLNTTGNVLDPSGRRALRRFLLDGGGWAGVHSAADTEYDWPFYTRILAGGRFLCHPAQQPGVIVREARKHVSTAHLEKRWQVPFEEFYSFTANPRGRARVLLSIDESTYQQDPNTSQLPTQEGELPEGTSGVMGDHPMSWQHRLGDGLSWYTALGHEIGMYVDPAYRQHLLGGLLTVLRHGRRRSVG